MCVCARVHLIESRAVCVLLTHKIRKESRATHAQRTAILVSKLVTLLSEKKILNCE